MAGEGDPSKGQQAEGESAGSRNKGGGTNLLGQLREKTRNWFAGNSEDKLESFAGEKPHVFQLLKQLNAAQSLQDGRHLLIEFRRQYGDFFATPRFPDQDGKPMLYEIRNLLILLQNVIDGENIPPQQIPRPIRNMCNRLKPSSYSGERRELENYIECTDQSGKTVRIPYKVVLKIQSEQGAQLSRGSRIMYGEGYENTKLIIPERKAIDSDSIAKAVKVEGYYWIIPHRVAADSLPILIRVTEDEYRRLYDKLPPAYKQRG